MWWLGSDTVKKYVDKTTKENVNYVTNTLTSINLACNNYSSNRPNNHHAYGTAKTWATQNCIRVQNWCTNKVQLSYLPQVLLPDVSVMQGTHRVELHLNPLLSTRAKTAHILPHLQSRALISIVRLFYDCCTTTFTAKDMKLVKQGKLLLWRHQKGGVGTWQVKISNNTPPPQPHTHQSTNNLM